MGYQVIQPSFARGEIGPSLWGRVDLAFYPIALKTCRNFIVRPTGGAVNRAGSRFICEVKDSTKRVRLLPFSFNADQTYVMEVGEGYIRVIQNGAQIYAPVDSLPNYSGVTTYSNGDAVQEFGVPYRSTQDINLNHVPSSSPTWWAPLETKVFEPSLYYLYEVKTPYMAYDLPMLRFTQSADVLTVVHGDYPPMDLKRYSNERWTFSEVGLNSGPFGETNIDKTLSVSPSANVGTVTLTASGDLFTAAHVGRLFKIEQKDFGVAWENGVAAAVGDVRRSDGKYYRALTAGTTGQDRPLGTDDHWNDGGVDWAYLHSGYGVARITGVTDTKTATADVITWLPDGTTAAGYGATILVGANSAAPDGQILGVATAHGLTVGSYGTCLANMTLSGGPYGAGTPRDVTLGYSVVDANTIKFNNPRAFGGSLLYTINSFKPPTSSNSASYKWAWGAFGDPSIGGPGYPTTASYHQQRLIFANTDNQPNAIWMSRAGNRLDFSTSSPIVDDDPITKTLASTQIDAIKALHTMDNLVVITSGAVWVTGGGQDDALTPGNTAFKLQGYEGASDLPVIGVGRRALYVQNMGQVVCDLIYEFANNGYSSDDLTVMAPHLLEGHSITAWAYQKTPFRCVWMVRDDGVLLGLTYMREQQVMGWHRHDTDGFYEDVCVVGEGGEDAVYVAVRRVINGVTKRYIERFESRAWTSVEDAFVVDAGLSFDGSSHPTLSHDITITGGTTWDENDMGLTVTASAFVDIMFHPAPSTSDIGDQLVWSDPDGTTYRFTITAVSDYNTATGRLNRPLPVAYRGVPIYPWSWARNTFSGLDHLEGKEVAILADGRPQVHKTVTAGIVTLDQPAVKVHIGLPIQSDLETLDLSIPGTESILAKNKAIASATVLTQDTQTIAVGRDFSNLERETVEITNYDQPVPLTTGKVTLNMDTDWSKTATVCIRVDDPVPVGVLAIIPNVSVGG